MGTFGKLSRFFPVFYSYHELNLGTESDPKVVMSILYLVNFKKLYIIHLFYC